MKHFLYKRKGFKDLNRDVNLKYYKTIKKIKRGLSCHFL